MYSFIIWEQVSIFIIELLNFSIYLMCIKYGRSFWRASEENWNSSGHVTEYWYLPCLHDVYMKSRHPALPFIVDNFNSLALNQWHWCENSVLIELHKIAIKQETHLFWVHKQMPEVFGKKITKPRSFTDCLLAVLKCIYRTIWHHSNYNSH